MAKAKTSVSVSKASEDVQAFVKGQWLEAQDRLHTFESEAQKVIKDFLTRSKESRKDLDDLLKKWEPLANPSLRELGRKAEAAGEELKGLMDNLQSRVIALVGVASQSQVADIAKELSRLSKKVDALSAKKTARTSKN
jgi:hypothetical protein